MTADELVAVRQVLHVECCLASSSTERLDVVREHVSNYLRQSQTVSTDTVLTSFDNEPFLSEHVKSISLCETQGHHVVHIENCATQIHVYQLNEDGPSDELDEEDATTNSQLLLPSKELTGLWDSLIFDSDVKHRLLEYLSTATLLSELEVDCNIVSWNRVVLLHGPPGTGKTSLAKALAQKLSIRLYEKYNHFLLLEINSHSLFSKWFSESGKLVTKLFQRLQDLIRDEDTFICILLDEVESLTAARQAALAGSEPSDSIRAVNALLTQIDLLKRKKNVLLIATSNITGAIDLAFVDRADVKEYIGVPSIAGIYSILRSCIYELMRVGLIYCYQNLLDHKSIALMCGVNTESTKYSIWLLDIAKQCHGLSGRSLRKLPFIAHAFYIQKRQFTMEEFLTALSKAVVFECSSRSALEPMPAKR